MTKKILSLILSIALVFTTFAFTTVSASESTFISEGNFLFQDYQDASNTVMSAPYGNGDSRRGFVEIVNEVDFVPSAMDDTNKVARITKNSGQAAVSILNTTLADIQQDIYTVEFDIYPLVDNASGVEVMLNPPHQRNLGGLANGFYVHIADSAFPANEWSTIKINVDFSALRANSGLSFVQEQNTYVKVYVNGTQLSILNQWQNGYRLRTNSGQFSFAANSPSMYDAASNPVFVMGFRNIFSACANFADMENLIDNIKIYRPGVALDKAHFENASGRTEVIDGSLKAVAKMTNDTAAPETVTAVLTAYDANGKLISAPVLTNWTLPAVSSAEYTTGNLNVSGASSVELAVWDSVSAMRPVGKTVVLGATPTVSVSTSTAMDIVSPKPEAEYEEGQDIVLQTQPTSAPDYVDYYINGVWVGKGLKSQSYKYTLKNPRCGTYTVSAVASDGEGSPSHVIYVRKTRAATISCDGTVEYGKSLPVNIAISGVTNVSRVEYYAGGQLVAQSTSAPFDAAVSGLKVGSSVISARVYDENGSYFNSNSVVINVNAGSSSDFKQLYY